MTTVDRISVNRDQPDPGVPGALRSSWVSLWCPWLLPSGWTMSGAGWAGGVRASAVADIGPARLSRGPTDLVLVAEEPGVGLSSRLAGTPGLDPGPWWTEARVQPRPGYAAWAVHAKDRAGSHPTPLWSVKSPTDRSAHAGEARGIWLHAIAWPASAGCVLSEDVEPHDVTEWTPPEFGYGAPSRYLRGRV